eukprot:9639177-Alexandrium_andersonii.AAC.1
MHVHAYALRSVHEQEHTRAQYTHRSTNATTKQTSGAALIDTHATLLCRLALSARAAVSQSPPS